MHPNPNKRCIDCGKAVSRPDVMRCHSCARTHRYAEERKLMTPPNPTGLCMCGCGQPAPIAKQSNRKTGWVKGQPLRWIKGHEHRPNCPYYTVDESTGCWEWNWSRSDTGYGRIHDKQAHRVIYEQMVGPIPPGLHLDHLCRNRGCVNPDHMEPVTNAENVRRGLNTKLTAAQVEEIRALYATGKYRQVDLAQQFGVTQCHISKLVLRQAWCHSVSLGDYEIPE